ncbi:MAG: hypothetical protein EP298_01570 [Gammaproteobacteria bacterium]|nr:MAG: hypothetical protein EP298_01570 [Gammaproteobacteria bacterium]UTW43894.1 hypothetical protein KFE69_07340 [bacterium SCSIO 12844]
MPRIKRPNFTAEQKRLFKTKLEDYNGQGLTHNCHRISYARIRDKIFEFVDGKIDENYLLNEFIQKQLYPRGISSKKINQIINLINNVLNEKPRAINNLVKELNSSDQNLRPGAAKPNMSIKQKDDYHVTENKRKRHDDNKSSPISNKKSKILDSNNTTYSFTPDSKRVMAHATPSKDRLPLTSDEQFLKTSSIDNNGKPFNSIPVELFTPESNKLLKRIKKEPISPYKPPKQNLIEPSSIFHDQENKENIHTLRSGKIISKF